MKFEPLSLILCVLVSLFSWMNAYGQVDEIPPGPATWEELGLPQCNLTNQDWNSTNIPCVSRYWAPGYGIWCTSDNKPPQYKHWSRSGANPHPVCDASSPWPVSVSFPPNRCPTGYFLTTNAQGEICRRVAGAVSPEKEIGQSSYCPSEYVGSTGGNNFIEEVESTASMGSLNFLRYYNSNERLISAPLNQADSIGKYWRHSFQSDVTATDIAGTRYATVTRADGKTLYFVEGPAGFYSDPDVTESLSANVDGSGNIVGWELLSNENKSLSYDSAGKLVQVSDRNGYVQSLSYNSGGQLASVTDSTGRALLFTYNADNRLSALVTDDGRETRYSYDASGNLVSTIFPDDTPATFNDNPRKTYVYEDVNWPHLLTGIVDEHGVRERTWTYLGNGALSSYEQSNGIGRVSYEYGADGSFAVLNELSKRTTYTYEIIFGQRKLSTVIGEVSANCPATTRSYNYNADGWVVDQIDWNGTTTHFERNDKGLVVARTEAVGLPEQRVVSTEWHSIYRLPLRVVDESKTIEYTYNANGALVAVRELNNP